ncbi:MAG: helix-turn-helix domain-containing protein [Myxococcales bacterium]|nr:helix-turn-helix domain-containing protein [Myxococcales bacterium]MCB9716041.1 helix-turn-helix domain-containing protein [Myxococcales bacterium]
MTSPPPLPLVRTRYLLRHVDAYRRMGGNPEQLLQEAGIPEIAPLSADALVPLERLNDVARIAIRDMGPSILQYAVPHRLDDLGTCGRRIAESTSLQDAISTFVRAIKGESAGADFFLERRPGVLWWCRGPIGTSCDLLESHAERFVLHGMLTVVRHWVGAHWLPHELWLTTGPSSEDERFRSIARVRYRARVLAFPISHRLLRRASPEPVLPRRASTGPHLDLDRLSFVESTALVVESFLPEGSPGIEHASNLLGMSGRSLQRRLNELGTTYSKLLAETRQKLATEWLVESKRSVTDIAHDLGYSDSAHFTRAFRRWVGVGPRRFRVLAQETEPEEAPVDRGHEVLPFRGGPGCKVAQRK